MEINFINFNGIEEYINVMYNDVKDSDKYKIEVAYNGKDIKKVIEYIYKLQNNKNKALNYMENYIEKEELNEPVKIEFKEIIKILKGE